MPPTKEMNTISIIPPVDRPNRFDRMFGLVPAMLIGAGIYLFLMDSGSVHTAAAVVVFLGTTWMLSVPFRRGCWAIRNGLYYIDSDPLRLTFGWLAGLLVLSASTCLMLALSPEDIDLGNAAYTLGVLSLVISALRGILARLQNPFNF
jgi:hypothetical protein